MILSEEYTISKFYQYAGYVKANRLSKSFQGGCPTCREGASWGKKRRLYYVVKKNLIFCHNCGLSMRPARWIHTVSGLSYAEIMKEASNLVIEANSEPVATSDTRPVPLVDILPTDSINLFDTTQVAYYADNLFVKAATQLLHSRRLDTAVNRPHTLWLSLTDKIHKNRLVIPFYDQNNKIVHYQTRTVVENKKYKLPKYLSKSGSEKTLFGINNVDSNIKYIFITEGPIDACFIKNGIAVAGITEGRGNVLTPRQQEQLLQFPTHEQIWVLDNQHIDRASFTKTKYLLKQGCKVFIWPKKLKKFKDLNDLCIHQKIDCIPEKFILKNCYTGVKGEFILAGKT